MKRAVIIAQLESYQHSRLDQPRLQALTQLFLSGISPWIRRTQGAFAERAVLQALEAVLANPSYSHLCLEALLQLCRDDPFPFAPWQDATLIARINMNRYFILLSADDLYVETQEGVV